MTQNLFQLALESGLHVYLPRVEQGIEFYGAIYGGYYVTNVRLNRPHFTRHKKVGINTIGGIDARKKKIHS